MCIPCGVTSVITCRLHLMGQSCPGKGENCICHTTAGGGGGGGGFSIEVPGSGPPGWGAGRRERRGERPLNIDPVAQVAGS